MKPPCGQPNGVASQPLSGSAQAAAPSLASVGVMPTDGAAAAVAGRREPAPGQRRCHACHAGQHGRLHPQAGADTGPDRRPALSPSRLRSAVQRSRRGSGRRQHDRRRCASAMWNARRAGRGRRPPRPPRGPSCGLRKRASMRGDEDPTRAGRSTSSTSPPSCTACAPGAATGARTRARRRWARPGRPRAHPRSTTRATR